MRIVLPVLALLLLSPLAFGQATLAPDASADQILQALHARGQGLKDFTADVSLGESDALSGDTTTLTGKVWYQSKSGGDARIHILFDTKTIGQQVNKNAKQEYLLDNGTLVELDFPRKLRITREVLRPGQKLNILKLGEGPFPLPIGQDPQDVKNMFQVSKAPTKPEEPANTLHLQLQPKPGTKFARKFKVIDVWVDPKTNFPTRIETTDPKQTTLRTTDLANIKVNTALTDRDFLLPQTPGWSQRHEALED